MTPETDIRQKRLLELLKNSAQPIKSDVPDPNQPQMARIMVGNGGISGLPKPEASQPPPPPSNLPNIPIGLPSPNGDALKPLTEVQRIDPSKVDFRPFGDNASSSQRASVKLETLRDASPRSSITTTDNGISVGAPKPKGHGLLNTLKNLGKGALIGTGEYARTHPGAELGELIGAGGAGGVVGAVKPETIDYVTRQAQIGQAENELNQQLGVDEKQAQIGARQAEPALRAQQIANESEYRKGQQEIQKQLEQGRIDRAEAQRQMEALRNTEAERHNREMERQGQAKIDKPAKDTEDYGQSADWNYKKQKEAETSLAGYEAQLKALPRQTNENYYEVKDQKDRLEKLIDESRQNAQKYRDEGDKSAAKVKTAQSGPTVQKPETRKGTISKEQQQLWLSHNPGKTVEDMKKLYPNAVVVN